MIELQKCAFHATYGQMRIAADLACDLGLVPSGTREHNPGDGYRKHDPTDSRRNYEFPWFGIDRRNGSAFFNMWQNPPEGVKRVTFGEFVTLLYEAVAKPVPEVEYIGAHRVTYGEDSVKVGCTEVSRKEIEAILRHLDAMKKHKA